MLAFRIFVMLSCLVVVPLAAIFGSAFPDVVKTVLVDRIVAWSTGKQSEPSRELSGAGFSEVSAASGNSSRASAGGWEAPRWSGARGADSWPSSPQPAGNVVTAGAETAPSASPNARLAAASEVARESGSVYSSQSNPAGPAPLRQPLGQASDRSLAAQDAADATGRPGAKPLEAPDRFTAMERKLREHGATYYLLETWGQQGELYRFHCKMAVGNNPNYTRHFEATDHDALKAMSQVLERVEAWRAGRLQ